MSKEERKIRNLEHEIEYYSRVYPGSKKNRRNEEKVRKIGK